MLLQVTEASTVVLAGKACPSVKLDDKYYKLVDKLEALTEAVPSLVEAKSVTVKGPVLFKRGVVFKGDVLVVNGACNSCMPPAACEQLAASAGIQQWHVCVVLDGQEPQHE